MESIMKGTRIIPLLIPAIILFLISIIANAKAQNSENPFEGVWSDTVEVMGQTFHPALHIKPNADNPDSLVVTVTYPSIGLFEIAPENYNVEGDSLTIMLKNAFYKIGPRADGTHLEGTLSVNSRTYPISLHPTQPSILVPPRYREWPEANPSDVKSPESIVNAAYDAISFPEGKKPDWNRLKSLFLPDSRLIPTGRNSDTPRIYFRSVEEHFNRGLLEQLSSQQFVEYEIHSVTERFGDIAHVFSTYESLIKADDSEPLDRGINSIQLWNDGNRWWIANIFWHSEREGLSIPERYK